MSFSLSSLAPSPALLRERCNALSCVYGRTLTLEEAAELMVAILALISSILFTPPLVYHIFMRQAWLTGFFPCHSRQFLL